MIVLKFLLFIILWFITVFTIAIGVSLGLKTFKRSENNENKSSE